MKRRVQKKRWQLQNRDLGRVVKRMRDYHALATIKVGVARVMAAIDGVVGHE